MRWKILIKCIIGLCQEEELFMLAEKFRAKNKNLLFTFVDLEKSFDQVSREVICFALRRKGVPVYLANRVMSLIKIVKVLSQLIGNYQIHFM